MSKSFILTFSIFSFFVTSSNNFSTATYSPRMEFSKKEPVPINKKFVSATNYHAVESQCDDTPLITADGSRIDTSLLNRGKIRWVAVSQDFIKGNKLKYGDTIWVTVTDDTYFKFSGEQKGLTPAYVKNYKKVKSKMEGPWIVHDCMNSRFKNKIDFLVSSKERYLRGYFGKVHISWKKK